MKLPRPSRVDPLREGTQFAGKYEVIACLDQRAENAAYKVRDLASNQILLLRLCAADRAASPGFVDELRRSLLVERSLSHENVERIYAVGEHAGTAFVVCEYSGGRALADVLSERGRLPLPESLHLFRQVCAGLAHIHSTGVIHGNLSPHTILVTRTGAVKLAGTGLGDRPAGAAEDVRAAGSVFLEMLGGTAPPDLPRDVAAVIARCAYPRAGFRDGVELLQAASRLGSSSPASRSRLTLAELAGEEPADVNDIVPVFLAVVRRMMEMKSGGARHLGFSPRSVYVAPGGAVEVQAAPAAGGQHTVATEPKYCPPEMFRESPLEAGEPSDIYALGFVLYEILAGRRLFQFQFEDLGPDPDAFQWLRWHADAQKALTPLADIVPNVPRTLSDLVRRMTEKDPAQRIPTLAVVAEGLESIQTRVLDTQVPTRPPAGDVSSPRAARSRTKRFAVVALACGTAATAAAWFLWRAGTPPANGFPPTLDTPAGRMVLVSRPGSGSFYVDEYEVTNWQYGKFCAETKRPCPSAQAWPEYPVRDISREDFAAYARWAGKRLLSPDERPAAAPRFDRRRHPWQDQTSGDSLLGYRCAADPADAVKLASSSPWRRWLRQAGWR